MCMGGSSRIISRRSKTPRQPLPQVACLPPKEAQCNCNEFVDNQPELAHSTTRFCRKFGGSMCYNRLWPVGVVPASYDRSEWHLPDGGYCPSDMTPCTTGPPSEYPTKVASSLSLPTRWFGHTPHPHSPHPHSPHRPTVAACTPPHVRMETTFNGTPTLPPPVCSTLEGGGVRERPLCYARCSSR